MPMTNDHYKNIDSLYQEIYGLRDKLTKMYEVNNKLNSKLKGRHREILAIYRRINFTQVSEIKKLNKEIEMLKKALNFPTVPPPPNTI